MAKGLKPLVKMETPDPEVVEADCCGAERGQSRIGAFHVRIDGIWCAVVPTTGSEGRLGSRCYPIARCRNCTRPLADDTPVKPWTWGQDESLDNDIRRHARLLPDLLRQRAEKAATAAPAAEPAST